VLKGTTPKTVSGFLPQDGKRKIPDIGRNVQFVEENVLRSSVSWPSLVRIHRGRNNQEILGGSIHVKVEKINLGASKKGKKWCLGRVYTCGAEKV